MAWHQRSRPSARPTPVGRRSTTSAGVRREGRAARRQLHAAQGHTKIILGASGSGKSTIAEDHHGLLRADAGVGLGERAARRPADAKREMMAVRADLGHDLPGGRAVRLADGARERRLQALRGDRHAARGGRRARRGGARVRRARASTSTRCRRSCPAGSAGAWRLRGRWRSSRSILLYDEATTGLDPITAITVDDEIVKLRDLEGVSSIVVTHQLRDAFYVATHMAVRDARRHGAHRAGDAREGTTKPSSSCCGTASSCFEGDADDAAAVDAIRIFRTFLVAKDCDRYASHTFARLVGTEDRRADDRRHRRSPRVLDLQLTGAQGLLLAALLAEDAVRQRRRAQPGSPVRIAGVEVGAVTEVEFVGERST